MLKNKWILVVVIVIVGLLILLGNNSSKSEYREDDPGAYDSFAQCLTDKGYKVYGSQSCSFCEQQRQLFEGSFYLIDEKECDPRIPGNDAQLCRDKEITHTPTWIKEDENGNELQRFNPGVMTLLNLSEASGCLLDVQE